MLSLVKSGRFISGRITNPGTRIKITNRGVWYKYKLKRYDRDKNYQVDRNVQEKELGLVKYKLKEYEKYRDEGTDADIKFPPQFTSMGEYVDYLVECGQVLNMPPLEYKGTNLSEIEENDLKRDSLLDALNTFETLNQFEYPQGHKQFKEDEINLYNRDFLTQAHEEKQEKLSESLTLEGYIDKLRADGGDKIMEYNSNIYHYDPSNFEWCCKSITGHKLMDTLLILRWYNDAMHDKFKTLYNGCIPIAKQKNFDLDKTYVADCKIIMGAAVNKLYKTFFIKGRGRAGATDSPITARLRVILQERDKPFKFVIEDRLEHIRARFRARMFGITKTPEQICKDYSEKFPSKTIYTWRGDPSLLLDNSSSNMVSDKN